MATSRESFEHGEHNEKACNKLNSSGEFPDWTITTAFYAALQFVTSKIFPFEIKGTSDGTSVTFNNVADYQKFKSYKSNKRHELIKELVSKYCDEIADKYEWLLDTSWNARYHSHLHQDEIVRKAVNYMSDIKKFCRLK